MDNRALAQFLLGEKDTRPAYETDHRSLLFPGKLSGYNNAFSYAVPGILGGGAWDTMGDIVAGKPVSTDEIKHSANEAAGAAMMGSMPRAVAAPMDNAVGMFVGARSAKALPPDRVKALDAAKAREGRGLSPETIWEATGWGRVPGADPKRSWATELDDSAWKMKDPGGWLPQDTPSLWQKITRRAPAQRTEGKFSNVPLPQILDAPAELWAADPILRDIRVSGRYGSGVVETGENATGALRYREKADGGKVYLPIEVAARDPDAMLRTLNHEIQHRFAQKEGWPEGAFLSEAEGFGGKKKVPYSADTYAATGTHDPSASGHNDASQMWRTLNSRERLSALSPAEHLVRRWKDLWTNDSWGQMKPSDAEMQAELAKLLRVGASDYVGSAGEQLAEGSAQRLGMTRSERRETFPFSYKNPAVARSVTPDFAEAANEVARREAMNEAMHQRWATPVDVGDGVSRIRQAENRGVYKIGDEELASFDLYPNIGGATININEDVLMKLPPDARQKLIKAVQADARRSFNVDPRLEHSSNNVAFHAELAKVAPEQYFTDPRTYNDHLVSEARRQHGLSAGVQYHEGTPYIERRRMAGERPSFADELFGSRSSPNRLDEFDDAFLARTLGRSPATRIDAPMDSAVRRFSDWQRWRRGDVE